MKTFGTQCCAFGCKKRKRKKEDENRLRSDSEGSEDDESHIKRTFPRTFHAYVLLKICLFTPNETVYFTGLAWLFLFKLLLNRKS